MQMPDELLQTMSIGKTQPPIAFAATNVKFLSQFPDGHDELWSADIKACRYGEQCDVFEGVLFVESKTQSQETVHLFGIEFEDGYPRDFNPSLATKQQAFIEFLRGENAKDDEALGLLRKIFTGHEYACEGKATAAYLAVRGKEMNMGVGYRNDEGEYELIAVESTSWVEAGGLSFGELGKR
jgi:hypothetical protein